MILFRPRTIGIAALLIIMLPVATASAQDAVACQSRVITEMAAAKDLYRSSIFGSVRATPPSGIKTSGSARVKGGGYAPFERKGMLESPGVMTSDLVPALVQSYQAYRCRIQAVCARAIHSLYRPPNSPQYTQISQDALAKVMLGCDVESSADSRDAFAECRYGGWDISYYTSMWGFCESVKESTLQVERDTLQLAVSYDSAYRSMLQFTGMLDWMLGDARQQTLVPLRDAVRWLGRLHTIPCFIGQCDQVLPGTSASSSSPPPTQPSTTPPPPASPIGSGGQGFPQLNP